MFAPIVRRIDSIVHRVENAFLFLALAVMLGVMLASIGARYLLNSPITWSEELLLIIFVWSIFVGASASFRHRSHMRVDLLIMFLPRKLAAAVAVAGILFVFGLMSVLAMSTIDYVLAIHGNRSPMLGIPVAAVFWVVPASMLLSALHILRNILDEGIEKALASSTEVAGT